MENKYKSIIWQLESAFSGFMMSESVLPAVIRAIFIKYCTDNFLYAESRDEMLIYGNIQKNLANRDVNGFIDSLVPMLKMIDEKSGLDGLLFRMHSSISSDLIGMSYKKVVYSLEAATRILDILGSVDLEISDDKDVLIDELKNFVFETSPRSGKYGGNYVTSRSMCLLAASLLDIGEKDSFADFACGYGLSTLEVLEYAKSKNNGGYNKLFLSDVNVEVVPIAAMLLIISRGSLDNVLVKVENSLDDPTLAEPVDTLFVDYPFATRIDRERYGFSDGTVHAIYKTINSLKDNGRGVITCAAGILFKGNKETIELRNYLLHNKYIEAIVTLPPVMYGTTINPIFMILSKRRNDEVLFIDASSNSFMQFSNNARLNTELIGEGIENIVRIVKDKEVISGVSGLCNVVDLLAEDTLVPAKYIEVVKEKTGPSVSEIEAVLRDLYDELEKITH